MYILYRTNVDPGVAVNSSVTAKSVDLHEPCRRNKVPGGKLVADTPLH